MSVAGLPMMCGGIPPLWISWELLLATGEEHLRCSKESHNAG
jgi:hypothetical protein